MSERAPHTESGLVNFVRAIDVRAPQELHERIDALVAERSSASGERPRAAGSIGGPAWLGRRLGVAATAGAIVLAALVVALASTGGSTAMSSGRAFALTQGAAGMPAPAASTGGAELQARVEDVAFPDWGARYGWRSAGERIGRVGDRAVTTVFYETYGGRRIGYAIVAGTPAPGVSGGVVRRLDGTDYRVVSIAGGRIVTWLRDGRLCVIGAQNVSANALLALASSS